MSNPFSTATEFCETTGMTVPSDLARLQAILDQASALVRRYTGQTLSQVTGDVVTLLPVERETLLLPERPVTAVSSVLVSGSPVTDFYFTRAGRLIRGSVTGATGTTWTQGATVTYSHGYGEFEPEFIAIKSVVITMTKRAFTNDEQGGAVALGGIPMETSGFPMQLFLTTSEMNELMDLGKVGVG